MKREVRSASYLTVTLLNFLQESERKAAEALERERAANEACEVRSSSHFVTNHLTLPQVSESKAVRDRVAREVRPNSLHGDIADISPGKREESRRSA